LVVSSRLLIFLKVKVTIYRKEEKGMLDINKDERMKKALEGVVSIHPTVGQLIPYIFNGKYEVDIETEEDGCIHVIRDEQIPADYERIEDYKHYLVEDISVEHAPENPELILLIVKCKKT